MVIRAISPNDGMFDAQHPAAAVIEHFRKHDVLIGRQFPFMDTNVRISFDTPPEMSAFWHAWDMRPWQTKMEM